MPPNGNALTITNPLILYRSLVATKQIIADPAQHRLALHLQKLYENLKDYEPAIEYSQRLQQLSRTVAAGQNSSSTTEKTSGTATTFGTRGIWTSLLQQKEKRDSLALTRVLTSHDAALALQSPKGLMLHGEVGTGKSMLIDLFFHCLPNSKKRRYHFNSFMLDTMSKLESLRMTRSTGTRTLGADKYSLLWLARDLIETSPILFLDEFQLPDRAASKILSNLMTSFFQLGGVLVATSNRMPEELAKAAGMEFARPVSRFSRLGWSLGMSGYTQRDNGPGQRGEFAQFLEVLRARCEVWEMEGKKDYRRLGDGEHGLAISKGASENALSLATALKTSSESPDPDHADGTVLPRYYLIQPLAAGDAVAQADFASAFNAAISTATGASFPVPWKPAAPLTVYGRNVTISRQHSGTALFSFDELCGASLGPADFITLASTFHTLILTEVPILTFLQKNEARRFITLLDALYEARCRLLITAAAGPDETFFPEHPTTAASATEGTLTNDTVHSETFSEIHQDLTQPFRPNISSYGSSSLSEDALEDDPPNRFRHPGTSFTDERRNLLREGVKAPDFANIGGLTGEDERFAVKRARSRIWEMCSTRWWARTGGDRQLENAAEGKGWWRPLPLESRHWEHSTSSQSQKDTRTFEPPTEKSGVRELGLSTTEDRHKGLFKHGASPFRTASEPPAEIGWSHIWGTVRWGKRAGAWGKGVEGLQERRKQKETGRQD